MDLKKFLLALCLGLIVLRHTASHVTSAPGHVPPIYEQTILKQFDPSAAGYFYSLQLFHAGDLHGQHTPIESYDHKRVIAWLDLLTEFIPQSEIAPFMATFYFSNTGNRSAIYGLIDFLTRYAQRDLNTRWRWYTYGIYLAHHHLDDFTYAYQLSTALLNHDLPLWVKDMPASLMVKMNRYEHAAAFLKNLLRSAQNLSPEEQRFLQFRLKSITD
jgi:hypothetical protein